MELCCADHHGKVSFGDRKPVEICESRVRTMLLGTILMAVLSLQCFCSVVNAGFSSCTQPL